MEKLDNQALTRFERLWKIEGDKLLRANTVSYTHLDVYKRQVGTGGLNHETKQKKDRQQTFCGR